MSAVEARITDTGQGLGVYHIHFLVAGSWEACTIPGSSKSIRALALLCVGRAAGATFGSGDLDAPVGCTPLDLTLRVTTVTRAARSTESDSEETV